MGILLVYLQIVGSKLVTITWNTIQFKKEDFFHLSSISIVNAAQPIDTWQSAALHTTLRLRTVRRVYKSAVCWSPPSILYTSELSLTLCWLLGLFSTFHIVLARRRLQTATVEAACVHLFEDCIITTSAGRARRQRFPSINHHPSIPKELGGDRFQPADEVVYCLVPPTLQNAVISLCIALYRSPNKRSPASASCHHTL